jgi:hypothetical protein
MRTVFRYLHPRYEMAKVVSSALLIVVLKMRTQSQTSAFPTLVPALGLCVLELNEGESRLIGQYIVRQYMPVLTVEGDIAIALPACAGLRFHKQIESIDYRLLVT